MDNNKEVKAVEKWRLSVKWEGKYRPSPEYDSVEEACRNIVPFAKKSARFLNVTIERIIRYEAAQ